MITTIILNIPKTLSIEIWYFLSPLKGIRAVSWQNEQNSLCSQRRLRSAWASAQSDQSWLSAWWKLGPLATHWAHSKDWSDWASDWADADPSLRWAHSSFYWFCHVAAHFSNIMMIWGLCSMKRCFGSERISLLAGYKPTIPWSGRETEKAGIWRW